jgi:hypothetical protein
MASCPGDVNGDGVINFADLNEALAGYSSGGFAALDAVLANFGTVCD